jgi:uncharacterized protein
MRLEQSFNVEAPPARVWEVLLDVERVAPCLPGAEITDRADDGAYEGTFSVKLGPATAAYRGRLAMDHVDEEAHTATMRAKGTDKRGQGGATATIVSTVHEDGSGARVDVVTDFAITGRLARFGRPGMIEEVSKRLLREFAACLQSTVAAQPAQATGVLAEPAHAPVTEHPGTQQPEPRPASRPAAAKPVNALSLFASVVWERLKRLFNRGHDSGS